MYLITINAQKALLVMGYKCCAWLFTGFSYELGTFNPKKIIHRGNETWNVYGRSHIFL